MTSMAVNDSITYHKVQSQWDVESLLVSLCKIALKTEACLKEFHPFFFCNALIPGQPWAKHETEGQVI